MSTLYAGFYIRQFCKKCDRTRSSFRTGQRLSDGLVYDLVPMNKCHRLLRTKLPAKGLHIGGRQLQCLYRIAPLRAKYRLL